MRGGKEKKQAALSPEKGIAEEKRLYPSADLGRTCAHGERGRGKKADS